MRMSEGVSVEVVSMFFLLVSLCFLNLFCLFKTLPSISYCNFFIANRYFLVVEKGFRC